MPIQKSIKCSIELQPKQKEVLWAMNRDHRLIGCGGSRGGAKALRIDEKIPVPYTTSVTGYKTMGELQVGDEVFSGDGSVTHVTSLSPIRCSKCYNIHFDTGEVICADGEHLWKTMDHKERVQSRHLTPEWREARRARRKSRAKPEFAGTKSSAVTTLLNQTREHKYLEPPKGSIRTTLEISETLTVQDGRELNHCIPVCQGICGDSEMMLPVDPYVYGLWLGDGDSDRGVIGMSKVDMDELLEFLPKPARSTVDTRNRASPFMRIRLDGLTSILNMMGVLKSKEITSMYLRASREQRVALLQGLMDTDGTCDKRGQCSFTSTIRVLADGFHDLVSSLGIKTTMYTGEAKCNGKSYGDCYTFKFLSPFPVFRLKRKLVRQKLEGFRPTVTRRYITKVEPCGEADVCCITVAHPSGMFLVGKTFIPTHNSHGARSLAILRRLAFPGTKGLIFRRTYDQLWQQHVLKVQQEWPELYAQTWSAENKALMLPYGGAVFFRYGDTTKDILEFKGKEYEDIFIDESTDLTEEEIKILTSCARTTRKDIKSKCVLMFNPGGVSSAFHKRIFIDQNMTPEEKLLKPFFIKTYAWDNVYWVAAELEKDGIPTWQWYGWPEEKKIEYLTTRSDYGRELNALPEDMRRLWLYGDWDYVPGAQFSEFDRRIHVCEPFEIPSWWHRWGSNDPGFNDPGVWHTFAVDQDGTVYVDREWYFNKRDPYTKQARTVFASVKDQLDFWVTGMDAFNKHPETSESICGYYQKSGLYGFLQPDNGKGCIARRTAALHELLQPIEGADGKKTAKIKFFSTCKHAIEAIPAIPSNPNSPDQYAECIHDHVLDSVTMGCAMLHASPEKFVNKRFEDGTMGAIDGHNKEFEQEEDAERNIQDRSVSSAEKFLRERGWV